FGENRKIIDKLRAMVEHDESWRVRYAAFLALNEAGSVQPGMKLPLLDRLRARLLKPAFEAQRPRWAAWRGGTRKCSVASGGRSPWFRPSFLQVDLKSVESIVAHSPSPFMRDLNLGSLSRPPRNSCSRLTTFCLRSGYSLSSHSRNSGCTAPGS